MKTHYFKIRIDDTALDTTLAVCKGSSKYSYCTEGLMTSNPHQHIYLEHTLSEGAIRKRIKSLPSYKAHDKKGNSFYSLGQLLADDFDPEFPYIQYHTYMAKQGEPTYVGFHPADVICLDAAIENYSDWLKTQRKMQKKSKRKIFEQIEDHYKWHPKNNRPMNVQSICQDVISYYKGHGKLFRGHQIETNIRTLCAKWIPGYAGTYAHQLMYRVSVTDREYYQLPPLRADGVADPEWRQYITKD